MTAQADVDDPSRRDRILAAAVDEFSAKGFAAVRIDRIAELAGCNKGLIYYYFDSKEGLYAAVIDSLIANYRPFWVAINDSTFQEWHARQVEWERDPRAQTWLRLLTMEGLADDVDSTAPQEAERTRTWRELVKLVARAQDRGEVDPALDADLVALTFSLWMVMPRVLPQITRMVTGYRPEDPAFTERLVRFQQEMLSRLAPRPAAAAGPPADDGS